MTPAMELPDASERERAATTFDRNVVVTAGAGTGKTRLLIDRLAHLLMREPEVKLTEVVALTFTNKAAQEIKLRLRERLESYVEARLDAAPPSAKEEAAQNEVRALLERYHLSKEQLDRRALDALRQIERSEIGTIHSFAATLLRLYPMQSGVDPQFIEDDGARFDLLFDELWGVWLDDELSRRSSRPEEWKRALRKVDLAEARALAASLCSETVDLGRLRAAAREDEMPAAVMDWLRSLAEKAADLIGRHPENRSNEKLVRAARDILEKFIGAGDPGDCAPVEDQLSGNINRSLKGWPEEDCDAAQDILRAARGLSRVDGALCRGLADLLIPFAEHFRAAFTRAGLISFDGLLARARSLVRDHGTVREQLKRRFKAILIDEFQDTDPIQYEILIYLAEEIGRTATDWRKVALVPGKIFVVGDPKQSIYAFRRADIEAYLEVVEKIIKAQNGVECRLTTNFRSHGKIIDAVNGVFARLIRPQPGLQPEYVAIEPVPASGGDGETNGLPLRQVAVRIVRGGDEKEPGARVPRRLEAESLARWLDEEIVGKAEIVDGEGIRRPVRLKDVAFLFRKLTDLHHYIEPLRRRGLKYVVEGERHFYAAQEIIDAVNLLRAVDNPHDRLALVGVLRAPLGGLADAEIYDLHRRGLLDYRGADKKKKNTSAKVKELYAILARLNREVRALPVGEAIARVFESAPVRLLAAAAFHGEQAVANLEKLRQQAESMGREGLSTFKEVIARLETRVLEIREEAESALAEENLDAIRMLSVHKSKGLEFPVVVLAGCDTIPNQAGDREPAVLQDWSSNLMGIRAGSFSNLTALYIAEKTRRRELEEQKRVLYVAMTRAREHLTISAAAEKGRAGSYLAMLEGVLGAELAEGKEPGPIAAGAGKIELQIVDESLAPPVKARAAREDAPLPIDLPSYARLWRDRAAARETTLQTPLFLTPTLLKRREAELSDAVPEEEKRAPASQTPLLIGDLAHRFLEHWDFGEDPADFRARLDPFLAKWLAPGLREERARLQRELERIFDAFFSSSVYKDLCSAQILGREIPFLIPWDGAIMEGVIDLVYEKDGRLFLADYKTDRVKKGGLAAAAARHRSQVEIYSEAARRALKRDVGFKLIFLRLGAAVEAP